MNLPKEKINIGRNDEEEDAEMTNCPHNMGLEAEQFPQSTTQPPVEQWPTEEPGIYKTKENRSLEGQDETNQAPSDDNSKRIDISKENMDVGRNDEEKPVPDENITGEDDEPPGTDDVSEDDDTAVVEAIDEPYTETCDERTRQHVNRMYESPIDATAYNPGRDQPPC